MQSSSGSQLKFAATLTWLLFLLQCQCFMPAASLVTKKLCWRLLLLLLMQYFKSYTSILTSTCRLSVYIPIGPCVCCAELDVSLTRSESRLQILTLCMYYIHIIIHSTCFGWLNHFWGGFQRLAQGQILLGFVYWSLSFLCNNKTILF